MLEVVYIGNNLTKQKQLRREIKLTLAIILGPYPPRLTSAVVRCWDLSLPQLYGLVQVQPRWTGYDITEFRINIINGSSGEVLKRTTIPYYEGQNAHHYFNETLPGCVVSLNGNSSVLVSSTAFSSVHGESAPSSAIEARLDSGKFHN